MAEFVDRNTNTGFKSPAELMPSSWTRWRYADSGLGEQFGVFAAFDASRRTASLGVTLHSDIASNADTSSGCRRRDPGAKVRWRIYEVAVRPDLPPDLSCESETGACRRRQHDRSVCSRWPQAEALEDPILDEAAEGQREFRIGHSAEVDQRRGVLQSAWRRWSVRLPTDRVSAGRGHNRPPELLPAEAWRQRRKQSRRVSVDIRSELESRSQCSETLLGAGNSFVGSVITSIRAVRCSRGRESRSEDQGKGARPCRRVGDGWHCFGRCPLG